MVRADLEKNPAEVAAMFDEVALGYDRTRARLWLGRMNSWGRRMARAAGARPGRRILDVAAGTGTSGMALTAEGASVVACDFSEGMLAIGRRRHPAMDFVVGDGHRLPFADGSFDAVTISFGLRNVTDPESVLGEMLRVTRPGGVLTVCEFSLPVTPVRRALFTAYLRWIVPMTGRRVSSNPEAYVYLAESIRDWPSPDRLAGRIAAAGWQRVRWRALDGGVVHLHTAVAGPRGGRQEVPGTGAGTAVGAGVSGGAERSAGAAG
ncbi:ubiquinone/menaquinone biosynthesis methyltransferase [Streptomyces sp. ICBB 8177]|uniref:ubiquinone/menaquinone biosynthesis methyltransferase n=1 Tax=Streptomyces sp. ICBB 8177 TaxID=563922 RepID=UPI000D679E02|nr:ubiquinone/menaquinone biosynthesis methyltransferase [Streptomyces sp. ICBB 8177]PWI42727.1 bifunctional demethylmenaquinone methyltransferase/2-methoxy-6-polyprenyl-1,4-benzoquinol methylase [Streptomyces sp. ICBB 8177]